MSDIAGLFNIPSNENEFNQWSFAHAVHHIDINHGIYRRFLIALPGFILDPFDPENDQAAETWTYLHQDMHKNQNSVLGIAGFDLSNVDWKDQRQRAAWIQLNANEHLQAANILQIG